MNTIAIKEAEASWEAFKASLDKSHEAELARFKAPADGLSLFSFYSNKDYLKFDQVVNVLPKQYKFDENIIPIIYSCYVERNLSDQAFKYVTDAIQYFSEESKTPSIDLVDYKRKAQNEGMFDKLRDSLLNLRNLEPHDIPPIVPAIHNGKIKLQEFILGEIINALRIMRLKIRAVESIADEDRYNDILMAILRLRLPVWGWDISDQNRGGVSPAGINPGEIDHTITAAGISIALIEAFPLKGRDFTKVQKHILKCENYIRDLDRFYIVIYYLGERVHFNRTWDTYKADVNRVSYPPTWLLQASSLTEIAGQFTSVENMKIARTKHTNSEMFHIMIDLSIPPTVAP
jgi:hypothetical protein